MNITVIGLGNMGLPMAKNLIAAGHAVTGFDLAGANMAALREAGGQTAATIAAAVAEADAVITMLPAGKHVAEVMTGQGGVLKSIPARTKVLIDSSTIDVATAREVAADAAAQGIEMLDAPVSGGTGGAAAGTLTFMCGGTAAGFALAQPVLQGMGRVIIHAGPAGSGQVAKACNNMMLAINMIGVSEAFVMADKLGLDRKVLFDITSTATGRSWALTDNCPVPGLVEKAASSRGYTPGFMAALMLKDLGLAQQAAEAAGAPTPLGAHALRIVQAQVDAGGGGQDFSAVFPFLAALARDEAP